MIQKFINYIKDVRTEMAKVTWPGKQELTNSTTLVIIVSLVFSAFIFSADWVLNKAITFVFNMR